MRPPSHAKILARARCLLGSGLPDVREVLVLVELPEAALLRSSHAEMHLADAEWEEKFEQEQKLKLQEELIREQKFKERELLTKEGYDDQDSGVSSSALENFKIDKTSQN